VQKPRGGIPGVPQVIVWARRGSRNIEEPALDEAAHFRRERIGELVRKRTDDSRWTPPPVEPVEKLESQRRGGDAGA
jgi:hypothetical protein